MRGCGAGRHFADRNVDLLQQIVAKLRHTAARQGTEMRGQAREHRRQSVLRWLRHGGSDRLRLDHIDAEPQIFQRVGEFVLRLQLDSLLAVQ